MTGIKKRKYWYRTLTTCDALFFFFRSRKKKYREYFRYQKYYEKYYGYSSKRNYKSFCNLMIWRSFCAWIFVLSIPLIVLYYLLIFLSLTPGLNLDIIGYLVQKHSLPIKDQILIEKELEELWKKEDEAEKNLLQNKTKKC